MKRVKLRELGKGAYFLCGNGSLWAKVGAHGSHHDVFNARSVEDDRIATFAGNVAFRVPSASPAPQESDEWSFCANCGGDRLRSELDEHQRCQGCPAPKGAKK